MKKSTMAFLSFSALLSVNAFAPQKIWEAKNIIGRAPAADENADKKETKKDEAIQCKEKSRADLESELKKLVEDKEAILKELKELKDKKAQSKEIVNSSENTANVLQIMSQLSSLMISQQQQQQVLMAQMFPLMMQMNSSSSYMGNRSLAPYMSPYGFNSQNLPVYQSNDTLSALGNHWGIGMSYNDYFNPKSNQNSAGFMHVPYRFPSSESPLNYPLNINSLERQSLPQSQRIDGFDFSNSSPISGRNEFAPQLVKTKFMSI